MNPRCVMVEAAGVADGGATSLAPGAVLLEQDQRGGLATLAVGRPADVGHHPAAALAARISLMDEVLIPGLINVHTHLDLTSIGPQPYHPAGGFVGWIDMVRAGRAAMTPEDVRQSVRRGVQLLHAGGVVAVGDIAGAGRPEPLEELRSSALLGVSYTEFFGSGRRQEACVEAIHRLVDAEHASGRGSGGVRLGLQPHAPYSAGQRVYLAATQISLQTGVPVCTHLAETIDEQEFIAHGSGPIRRLLERLDIWDDTIAAEVGRGLTPVCHLVPHVGQAPYLVVHVNDCSDADLEILAASNVSVAYCPRASAYFGHPEILGPHRFRDMMNAGITVALGTDSILNVPADQADRLSPLDDARLLFRRDHVDARTLLRMMTTDGARALHLDSELFRFEEQGGAIAGLAAVSVSGTDPGLPPADRVMAATGRIRLLEPGSLLPQ